MIFKPTIFIAGAFLSLQSTAQAKTIKVVTTLTDIAWAAKEIGGSHVEVESFLTGSENPHYVDVLPSFVQKASNADVVCAIGLDLEIGWLPKVLEKSGNSKVQSGGKGFCELGKKITPLEKPAGAINRAMGDMHPQGNPHFWLSPNHFAEAAREIRDVLSKVDSKDAAAFSKNYEAFKAKMKGIDSKAKGKLAGVKGKLSKGQVIEYHKDFTYFFNNYGITSFGSVEEKPGVPPSAGRIADVASDAKSSKVKIVLGTPHSDRKVINKFKDLAKVKDFVIQTSIKSGGSASDYEAIQVKLASAIADALK